jgi:hypothetical protein
VSGLAWISTGSCAAAEQFGFLVGSLSGLFVDIIVVALVLSARSYRRDVPAIVDPRRRMAIQSLLVTLPWLLVIVWSACATYAGRAFVSCYATHLAITSAAVVAPIVATVLWAAANRIGTAGVRS